eukprot:COSAG05_NODE_268_length_12518_cov_6.452774_6_plen_51_part_00
MLAEPVLSRRGLAALAAGCGRAEPLNNCAAAACPLVLIAFTSSLLPRSSY